MTDSSPSISINGISHPILCGLCNAPIAERTESDADGGKFGCAACANWADQQEVADAAIQYAKDEGQMILNRAARDAARQSKIMTFTGKTKSDTRYRFIVDLQI